LAAIADDDEVGFGLYEINLHVVLLAEVRIRSIASATIKTTGIGRASGTCFDA